MFQNVLCAIRFENDGYIQLDKQLTRQIPVNKAICAKLHFVVSVFVLCAMTIKLNLI